MALDKSVVIPQRPIDQAVIFPGGAPTLRSTLVLSDGTPVDNANPLPISGTFAPDRPVQLQIINQTLTLANTEYGISLPANTIHLEFKTRGSGTLQFSFVAGETNTKYVTLKSGSTYSIREVSLTGKTLYVQSPTAGVVVEVLAWTK